MIGFLRGEVVHRQGNRCVVDVNGVGWEVYAPSRALDAWEGGPAQVFVHTHVREEEISLYGFASMVDKDAFVELIGVAGVGPKVALAALDALTVEALVRAVEQDDVVTLSRIKGVGKKTAQRLAIDLKGRIQVSFTPTLSPRAPAPVGDAFALALDRLGYGKAEIEHARRGIAEQGVPDDAPVADRVRAALRVLYAS